MSDQEFTVFKECVDFERIYWVVSRLTLFCDTGILPQHFSDHDKQSVIGGLFVRQTY